MSRGIIILKDNFLFQVIPAQISFSFNDIFVPRQRLSVNFTKMTSLGLNENSYVLT